MGQQQLLLLVLGIVIVGLAVVVGIQAFSENQKKSNADSLVNDAIRIASDAQAWKLKPAAFGGGAGAVEWTGLNFGQIGYTEGDQGFHPGTAATATMYENLNGTFALSGQVAGPLVITATSFDANDAALNTVVVTVAGTSTGNISTVIN